MLRKRFLSAQEASPKIIETAIAADRKRFLNMISLLNIA